MIPPPSFHDVLLHATYFVTGVGGRSKGAVKARDSELALARGSCCSERGSTSTAAAVKAEAAAKTPKAAKANAAKAKAAEAKAAKAGKQRPY
jgi:hypothetical protein